MTPEQKQIWNEIIEQCKARGEYYTKGINCGTAKRRATILAVHAELEALRQALAEFMASDESA